MNDIEDIERVDVKFNYALLIVKYMFEHRQLKDAIELAEYGFPVEHPNEQVSIFTGNLRNNVSKILGLSEAAVGSGMNILHSLRSITRLRGGGRGVESVYLLHYVPTFKDFKDLKERQGKLTRRIVPSKWDQMLNDMQEMKIRVKQLEERLAELENHPFPARGAHDRHNLR